MALPEDNAEMFAEVYDELRRIARRYYYGNPADYTLQPTALVNEAFTKIIRQQNVNPSNREQFLGVAALILKRKLLDHVKKKKALKAGGGVAFVEFDELFGPLQIPDVDLLALKQACERLRTLHPRQAKVVELRYFDGMTNEDVARTLGISVATVKTDWTIAQGFLFRVLRSAGETGDA